MADLRMPDINRVQLAGNLTRDPEMKYLPSGMAVCELGLAVSRKYRNKAGETQEETCFINCVCWGKTAEWVGEKVQKGEPVYVEGRLKYETWGEGDSKRSTIKVNADRVQQLSWTGGNAHAGGGNQGKPKQREIEEPIPEDDIPF